MILNLIGSKRVENTIPLKKKSHTSTCMPNEFLIKLYSLGYSCSDYDFQYSNRQTTYDIRDINNQFFLCLPG